MTSPGPDAPLDPETPPPARTRPLLAGTLIAVLVLGLAWLFLHGNEERPPTLHRLTRDLLSEPILGTSMTILLAGDESLRVPPEEALARALEAAEEVETLMSGTRAGSDVDRINSLGEPGCVQVDPRTWTVLQESMRYHRLSQGAFDITVKPLLHLYRFLRQEEPRLPSPGELAEARAKVGSRHLRLEERGLRVCTGRPGMKITLGAIAKGYAVDRAVETLVALGARNLLVEIGGEVRHLGRHPEGRPWRTTIENPFADHEGEKPYLRTLERSDCAVATSGNYKQYFEVGGQRYSHIVDPRTGLPAHNPLAAVTVIAPTCMQADALATALSVLGEEDGRRLLGLFEGVEAILQEELPDGELRVVEIPGPVADAAPDATPQPGSLAHPDGSR